MEWLKLWNGAHLDAIFPAVADLAGSTPGVAQGTYFALAEFSNAQESRGSIAGYEKLLPVIASYQRVGVDEIKRVVAALVELGKIAGERISAFAKRQGIAISEGAARVRTTASATRMRRLRERQKTGGEQIALDLAGERHTPVTPPVTTPRKKRETEIEERKELPSVASARATGAAPSFTSVNGKGKANVRQLRSTIPQDWQPDGLGCRFAREHGFDDERGANEVEKFRDHHLARGTLFADVSAGWRTWVQRAGDFDRRPGGGYGAGHGRSSSRPGSIIEAGRQALAELEMERQRAA